MWAQRDRREGGGTAKGGRLAAALAFFSLHFSDCVGIRTYCCRAFIVIYRCHSRAALCTISVKCKDVVCYFTRDHSKY